MLRRWQVSNFKSIGKPVDLELRGLTLLTGPNSVGKSSLIQSILVIAQTLASRQSDIPLLINGDLVTLGTPLDVWHAGSEIRAAQFQFDLHGAPIMGTEDTGAEQLLKVQTSFVRHQARKRGTSGDIRLAWAQVEVGQAPAGSVLRYKAASDPREFAASEREGPFRVDYESRQVSREWERHIFSQPWARHRAKYPQLAELNIAPQQFLPRGVLVRIEATEKERALVMEHYLEPLRASMPTSLPGAERESVPEPIRDAISEWAAQRKGRSSLRGRYFRDFIGFTRSINPRDRLELYKHLDDFARRWVAQASSQTSGSAWDVEEPLPDSIQQAVDEIRDFFTNRLHYISALRVAPQILWNLGSSRSWSVVGTHGEYLAQALHEHDAEPTRYWDPQTQTEQEKPLGVVLQRWLGYLELIDAVSTNDLGKLGYQVEVQDLGVQRKLDLTAVGLGISQVLPILVAGLLMEPGSTLLVEQPEVHLHPRAQSRLGDFFLSLTRTGRQVIVETHSEHLTNRLFRRIAESEPGSAELLERVGVYFAERQMGETVFRRVRPNSFGIVEDWPIGFFDEGALEAQAILEASMRKRIKLTR